MIQGVAGRASPGDLDARIAGDKLLIPDDVATAFRRRGVRTAEDLVSFMASFPAGAAETLHWSLQDILDATTRLRSELQGHVRQEFLRPPSRPNPPLGANDPDDIPW